MFVAAQNAMHFSYVPFRQSINPISIAHKRYEWSILQIIDVFGGVVDEDIGDGCKIANEGLLNLNLIHSCKS